MQLQIFFSVFRWSAVCLSILLVTIIANTALAGEYTVGDVIEPIRLDDQHGMSRTVDVADKIILFSRDKKGADLLKHGLQDVSLDCLREKDVVYVADISGMPRLIAWLLAIPRMRDLPYPILLDRDGTQTARLPDVEGQATFIFIDRFSITRIVHVADVPAVKRELDSASCEQE
ncbi:MAG: hypothetical protein C0622_02405 [Desulfuromonas sp.]|nr:MAG: hypothetical protein C0622_02405 [Desulfuromonas sp.]